MLCILASNSSTKDDDVVFFFTGHAIKHRHLAIAAKSFLFLHIFRLVTHTPHNLMETEEIFFLD